MIKIEPQELKNKLRSSLVKYFGQHDYNSWCYITWFVNGFMKVMESGEEMSSEDVECLKDEFKKQRDIEKKAKELDAVQDELNALKLMNAREFKVWRRNQNKKI